AVLVLMLALLAASQLLIRFILTHLHTLKDVMLHVEKSGDGADDALVAGLHGVEGTGHLADFVASLQRYASGQVAALLDV
ncbi:methyl-accepting chemotaxis protein, partial [Pseudomonas aeruginosa]|nr:methyl-accepting chemotaxis protein [Pseudomonas aeruginosa]